jgi:anti-sigma factor RsiW
MTEQTEIHTLAGAYVLDAVDDIERAAFDRHLRHCAACAVEVAELQLTTGRLVDAVATEPPSRMRAAVLAEISRTPQERPTRASRGPATTTRWRRMAAASVAAAILALGVGAATWSVADQRLGQERQRNAQIQAVLSAPDLRIMASSSSTVGGRLTLFVSQSRNAAVALVEGFANPGAQRVYQLWAVGADIRSAGLFKVGAGNGMEYIADLGPAEKVAVTNEPAEGSGKPTTNIVAEVPLNW